MVLNLVAFSKRGGCYSCLEDPSVQYMKWASNLKVSIERQFTVGAVGDIPSRNGLVVGTEHPIISARHWLTFYFRRPIGTRWCFHHSDRINVPHHFLEHILLWVHRQPTSVSLFVVNLVCLPERYSLTPLDYYQQWANLESDVLPNTKEKKTP